MAMRSGVEHVKPKRSNQLLFTGNIFVSDEPTSIRESMAKCASVAYNVSQYMNEIATIYKCNETGGYYFRLEKDNRPIPEGDESVSDTKSL